MAKSVQLFWAITAIFAGLFLERGLSQRQICSYYGMNLLSSCYDCYLAEVILLHSLKTRCVLNRFELKTYTAKLNIDSYVFPMSMLGKAEKFNSFLYPKNCALPQILHGILRRVLY